MGQTYNLFATVGRVNSYVTLSVCCIAAVALVALGLFWVPREKSFQGKDKGVATALLVSLASCLVACGVFFVVVTHKSKDVAALGGIGTIVSAFSD